MPAASKATGNNRHGMVFIRFPFSLKRRRADRSARRLRGFGRTSVQIAVPFEATRSPNVDGQLFLYFTPQPWGRVSSTAGVSPFSRASTASFR